MFNIRSIIICLFLVSSLSACNTMRGLGQDMQEAGESLENKAERNKKY